MPGSDFAFMGGRTVSKETEVLAEAKLGSFFSLPGPQSDNTAHEPCMCVQIQPQTWPGAHQYKKTERGAAFPAQGHG
jgi:hypothetical protein